MLTNIAYIRKQLGGFGFDDEALEIILLKSEVSPKDKADFIACDRAIYKHFSFLLGTMAKNVSEGGYSISWNVEAVKLYYNNLCQELKEPNVLLLASEEEAKAKMAVVDMSNIW